MALVVVALLAFRSAGQDEEDQRRAARQSTQSRSSAEESSGATLQGGTRNDGGARPGGGQTAPTAELTFRGGEVVGGEQTVEVQAGEEVTLAVTSDVRDEVHVHGFDRDADLEPGRTQELSFAAEAEGLFEIELHDSEVLLANLEVSPSR